MDGLSIEEQEQKGTKLYSNQNGIRIKTLDPKIFFCSVPILILYNLAFISAVKVAFALRIFPLTFRFLLF
jgi:hypothetical protein